MTLRTPLLFLALLILASCSGRSPASLSEKEQRIAHVYAELLFLNETFRSKLSDEEDRTYIDRVDSTLRVYDVDREEFEKEFLRLSQSPEKSKIVFDEAELKLRDLRQRGQGDSAPH